MGVDMKEMSLEDRKACIQGVAQEVAQEHDVAS
jgi:hypothetical protein